MRAPPPPSGPKNNPSAEIVFFSSPGSPGLFCICSLQKATGLPQWLCCYLLSMRTIPWPLLTVCLGIAFWSDGAVADAADWASVRPIIESRCLPCHGSERVRGGLMLTDASAFARGGDRGLIIDRSDWANSRILHVIAYDNPELAMPPSGMLPEDERLLLESWVLTGAHWPEGPEGVLVDSPEASEVLENANDAAAEWWSYQPIAARSFVGLGIESPSF